MLYLVGYTPDVPGRARGTAPTQRALAPSSHLPSTSPTPTEYPLHCSLHPPGTEIISCVYYTPYISIYLYTQPKIKLNLNSAPELFVSSRTRLSRRPWSRLKFDRLISKCLTLRSLNRSGWYYPCTEDQNK